VTTENVTVLFTDIVGSTRLASSLSPDDADEVRRGHFSILRQAIAEANGIEVKNLGDGLMVAFTSPSSALSCAVAMQQRVEQHNSSLALSVGLRVGVSGGEVSTESSDYFGDPVIEAARLCALCEGGQILVADVVQLTAGRRNRHKCHPVGTLTLKGLPDPVATVEVHWDPLIEVESVAVVPLPTRLAPRPQAGVVGREGEIDAITESVLRVANGDGRGVVLISGEAGQGKTTLAAEAGRAAFTSGACVLFGHCEENLATPYQLFAETLGHFITHVSEDRLLAHVAAHGSELARLVPALSSRIPDLPPSRATDSDSERYLLFAAVVGLLSLATELQPVLLVFDDLQWADQGSLMLLRHVAASDLPMRVLIVGTYRDTELARADALVEALGALRRLGDVTRIELTGLDDKGVASLMEAAAGHALDRIAVDLARAVCRETDGNPFFVGEVLRHLSETGAIYQDPTGKWTTDQGLDVMVLPDSVREVIRARVVRLGEGSERVLSLAAVIGRDFDVDLLVRATRVSEDDILDILDSAVEVALVRELANATGRYNFSHALIQHTLYEDFGPTRRARAHRAVAEALEDLCRGRPGSRVGELARHWFNATQPDNLVKAIDYSRQAGDAALESLAPDDALRYYTQALSLIERTDNPDPVVALDLRIGLGTAQRQTGDPGFRETLLDAARRAADINDTERLVAAALANDRGTFSTVDSADNEKLAILEMALGRLSEEDPVRALVLATLCSEVTIGSSLERRQSLARDAIAIAAAHGDDANMVRVLNHVLLPLAVPPLLGQSLTRSADALIRAERVGDPLLLCSAASGRRYTAACAGDIDEMDRCFAIKEPLVEQLDQPFLAWVHALQRSTRALIAGDTDEAESLASEAFQIGSAGGEPDAIVIYGAQMIMVNLWRGTLSQLVPLIEQAIVSNPRLPVFVAALALAHSEGERYEEATQLLREFGRTGFELPLDATWLTGMIAYADAAIDCRDVESSGPMLEQLAPFSEQWHYSDISTAGPISRTLGGLASVLGRYDEAESFFAHAAASSQRAHAKFFTARTELYWGLMLMTRRGVGDSERARHLLSSALATAVAFGYGNVERRANAALGSLA
jgi:class 3 adenylate cyclase/tetratricopeptide (TPR) repeat protein